MKKIQFSIDYPDSHIVVDDNFYPLCIVFNAEQNSHLAKVVGRHFNCFLPFEYEFSAKEDSGSFKIEELTALLDVRLITPVNGETEEEKYATKDFFRCLAVILKQLQRSNRDFKCHPRLIANSGFTCPECGGHYFGTMSTYSVVIISEYGERYPDKIRLGECRSKKPDGEKCTFSWLRNNESYEADCIYFMPRDVWANSYFDYLNHKKPSFSRKVGNNVDQVIATFDLHFLVNDGDSQHPSNTILTNFFKANGKDGIQETVVFETKAAAESSFSVMLAEAKRTLGSVGNTKSTEFHNASYAVFYFEDALAELSNI